MITTEKPTLRTSPKDFFIHLLMIAMLYTSTVSFLTLCFQYINFLFPDPLDFYLDALLNTIRWSTSVVFVAFPVYIFLARFLNIEYDKEPARRALNLRKWLIYLTLFLTAITMIVDLITLVNNFYGGELTLRFSLKVIIVFATAFAIFRYYLWDLRSETINFKKLKLFVYLSGLIVLATIIAGLFIIGTPSHQRKMRFDETRVNDLQILQSEIINYYSRNGALPKDIGALATNNPGFIAPQDPESGSQYEYSAQDISNFSLCAEFKTQSLVKTLRAAPMPFYKEAPSNFDWSYKPGHQCFTRIIDPAWYKKVM